MLAVQPASAIDLMELERTSASTQATSRAKLPHLQLVGGSGANTCTLVMRLIRLQTDVRLTVRSVLSRRCYLNHFRVRGYDAADSPPAFPTRKSECIEGEESSGFGSGPPSSPTPGPIGKRQTLHLSTMGFHVGSSLLSILTVIAR
jgi:hypothetical protein